MAEQLFELDCPHCGRLYRLAHEKILKFAGKQIRCKQCGQPFTMPDLSEAAPSASAAEEAPVLPAAASDDGTPAGQQVVPTVETDHEAEAAAPTPAHALAHGGTFAADPEPAAPQAVYTPPPGRSAVLPAIAETQHVDVGEAAPAEPPVAYAAPSREPAYAPAAPSAPQVVYALSPEAVKELGRIRAWVAFFAVSAVVLLAAMLVILIVRK
jgi:predicted Zn finger-like uncharacterized protein